MTDYSDPTKAKCIVKHLQLPTRNPVTLKFLNELLGHRAKILQRLSDHPALAKNLACIQEGADFYWVRSYVPGRSLQAELALNQPRPEPAVRRLMTEVLSCLEVLQYHSIVHQNLHPNNLIRHQSDEHLVVVDYSLAHEGDPPKSDSENNGNGNGGSPTARGQSPYLPQVSHRQCPHFNADHFALGMIALQFATGLAAEALPQFQQLDFLAQFKLQLDECSTLSEDTKNILVGMVSPRPEPEFSQSKAILARLAATPLSLDEPPSRTSIESGPTAPVKVKNDLAARPSNSKVAGPSKWWLALAGISILLLAGGLVLKLPQRMAVATLARQAEEAAAKGQTDAALNYLNQIIARQPDHVGTLAQRSSLLWDQGNSDQALQDITAAIQGQPDNPEWYFDRGNMRLHVGDQQGAIADYTEAIRINDRFSDAYVNRGNARAERGDEEGAVQDYTAALEIAEEPKVKAFAHLNRCLSLSNLRDDAQAILDCTAAINLQPNNSLAYENRGLVKRRLGDLQGALQDFTIAIQIDPSSPEPYYNRALTRQQLGDLDGAMKDLNRTVTLDPEHPFAYYDRGLLHVELGQTNQAMADFEQVATVCLEVGRVGCFEDAQYQLNELEVAVP
jgi:serine/threonine-protein kinase